ncbi:alcohol oxidase [Amylostereum chailletii]|nr:alcohol oxidase [Amylostereum chailletii]
MFTTSVQAAFLLLSLAAPRAVFATLLQSPDNSTQQLQATQYDYIIVGGGTAGGVLANRLTEDSNTKVLLIEAGSSDYEALNIQVPFLATALTSSTFDWNYTTVPQTALNDRQVGYARGRVLGGSSSINYMIYTRGSQDDYDRWAKVTGDSGWTWDSLHPYLLKLENFTVSRVENADAKYVSSIHSTSGPVGVGLPTVSLPTDQLVLNAQQELSSEFPFNKDVNSGDMIGISWTPFAIADGARSNSARDYIAPVLERSNLDVLVNTQVIKVLQTGDSNGTPIIRGVQFTSGPKSPVYNLTASKEVIISTGAIGTPQILLLSGIGPAEQSKALGINSIVDSPDVGQNLQDHPLLTSPYTVSSNDTLDNLGLNATFAAEQLAQWQANRTGDFTLGALNQWGWLRLPDNDAIFKNVTDPSAGSKSPHFQLIFTVRLSFSVFITYPTNLTTRMHTSLLAELQRQLATSSRCSATCGNLTLNNTDPFTHPIINPGLLSDEFDLYTMREALKTGRRFMNASAWNSWIVAEYGDFAAAQTDEQIEAYIRANALVVNHVVGTVGMGKAGSLAKGAGALNPDLTVKGVQGLRVIDASAFPFIPASHTMVPTYVLAERASDVIKGLSVSVNATTASNSNASSALPVPVAPALSLLSALLFALSTLF